MPGLCLSQLCHKLRGFYRALLLVVFSVLAIINGSRLGHAVVANDVMIFHFDELPPAGAFDDKSAVNANGFCNDSSDCPGVGGTGLRGTPLNDYAKRAADFNGETDCITIPDNSAHSLSLQNGLTLSAWILPRSLPTAGGAAAIVSKYSSSGDQREWILGIRNINGGPRLAFWKSSQGTSASTIAVYSVRVLQATDFNRWTHVLLRINASGSYEWWINGLFDSGSVIQDLLFKAGTATSRIGCVQKSTTAPDMLFRGKIDEILVARSYISDADIQAQYNWSRPQRPTMAYVAGLGKVGQEGSLLLSDGRINVTALAARLRDLRPDVYRFWIRRDQNCAVSCKDFQALGQLLQLLSVTNAYTKVIVERDPLWRYIEPAGAPAECFLKSSHEAVWGCAIGALAQSHPGRLIGWSIDDFFSEHPGPSGPTGSFLDRQHAINAGRALRARAPNLPIYATIYCSKVIKDDVPKRHDMSWRDPATLTYDQAMFDFLNRTGDDGIDPAELRRLISGVNLYVDPPDWIDGIAKQTIINRCLDGLRPLKLSGNFTLNEGVYITWNTDPVMTCAERRRNVSAARLSVPDGYVFYEMLSPLEPLEELQCSAENYNYDSLRTATQRASYFVTW